MNQTIANTWVFVPKPRSAIKTVLWFPAMLKIEGKLWNKKANNEHPVRREYLRYSHPFDEFKVDDPEINARMEFARYQTLGLAYLDDEEDKEDARIMITKAGRDLVASDNKEEIILRQLLKWQFPSNIHADSSFEKMRIFPLEIVIKVLEKYKEVNRFEVAFSFFTCTNISEVKDVFFKIDEFRRLVNGKPASQHRKIYFKNFEKYNGKTGNKPETYLGNYDDVLFRHLEYTSIFETSGRGDFTKLYIPERASIKFQQLAEKYKFVFFENYKNKNKFYEYFGDPYSTPLPWESSKLLGEIIRSKISILKKRVYQDQLTEALKIASTSKLKTLEAQLDSEILDKNEKEFIGSTSKTSEERSKIIQKFIDIDSGDEDLAALWLEVNTWKSLVAMKGTHYVKRNFKLEIDLTPRSFAAGTNNTPDMEFYNKKYILIPEVSIQSGVEQWITEGSSIVEHVLKFLEIKNGRIFLGIEDIEKYINKNNVKAIYGFFLCKKINRRLLWQLYVLNREAWLGEPIAIVPMEIKDYIRILQFIYKYNISALKFEELIEKLALSAKKCGSYEIWSEDVAGQIEKFIK